MTEHGHDEHEAPTDDADASEPGTPPDPETSEDTDRPDLDDEPEGIAGPTPHAPGAMPAMVSAPGAAGPPRRTGVFVDAESLRSHVGDLLRAYLGGYQVDAWGNYTFTFDEARIFVTVPMSPIGPQVGIFSITNVEIDLTPPLATFLLTTNHQLGFGAFSYDEENRAIWLRHTLLGTTLDAPELQAAVAAVASTAAHFDDAIRDRFGGRAFHDAPQEIQEQTKPPDASSNTPPTPNASGYL